MQDTQILIARLAAIILIALLGYYIASKKILGNQGKDVVSLLLNRIGLPMLVFSVYLKIELNFEVLRNAAYVILIALLVYLANYFYSKIMAKHYQLALNQKSVYIDGAVHSNTAFLAFPLLLAVYGNEGLLYATIYYMFDTTLMTTLGIKRLQDNSNEKSKLAPVTIALLISLPLMVLSNILNINLTNNFLYAAVNDLGTLTTPLAFLFIGFIVYETNIKEVLINKIATNLVFVKMTVVPLFFIIILKLLNLEISHLVIIVALTQAMMPPFSALLSLSNEYKQDVKLASSLVVLGHLYSIISIPLLFALAVHLFA